MSKKSIIVHPLLLAIYPILFLYSRNIDQVSPGVVVWPIMMALAATLSAWWLLRRLTGSTDKAAIAVSFLLVWFFSYGHVLDMGANGMSQRVLLPVWMASLIVASVALWKLSIDFKALGQFLNIVAVTLAVLILVRIGLYSGAGHRNVQNRTAAFPSPALPDTAKVVETRPDIYYIILDSYAGEQTLQTLYDYNNEPFLKELARRGFVVARYSHSNYPFTLTSMPSALNMQYDDTLARQMGKQSSDLAPLKACIRDNQVMRFLRAQGYTTLTLNSPGAPDDSDFGDMLRLSTLLRCIEDNSMKAARHKTLTLFDRLLHLPASQQPRFVYAHILCPHGPYVFGPNGEPTNYFRQQFHLVGPNENKKLYVGQLTYAGKRALQVIDHILAHSRVPPIIILQGDHGPGNLSPPWYPTDTGVNERLRILNAYYLPGQGKRMVYDTITPVNSFRLIFNHYFGTHLPRLADRSYFCTYAAPYKYLDVTGKIR